jgi:hypothetical protein
MQRSQDIESLEDHQRQRALQDIRFFFHITAILVSNRKNRTLPLGKQQVSHAHGFVNTLSQANVGEATGNRLFGTIAKATVWAYWLQQEDAEERSEDAPLASRR